MCASIAIFNHDKHISCWTTAHTSRVMETVASLLWECVLALRTSLQQAGQPQASVSLPLAQCFPEDILQLLRRHMREAFLELLICESMASTCTESGDLKLNIKLLNGAGRHASKRGCPSLHCRCMGSAGGALTSKVCP